MDKYPNDCISVNSRIANLLYKYRERNVSSIAYALEYAVDHLIEKDDPEKIWHLLEDENFRSQQIQHSPNYTNSLRDLRNGIEYYAARNGKSENDDPRLCWLVLRAGEMVRRLNIDIEVISECKKNNIVDVIDRLECLDAESFFLAAISIVIIDARQQLNLAEQDRNLVVLDIIAEKLNKRIEIINRVRYWHNYISPLFFTWFVKQLCNIYPHKSVSKVFMNVSFEECSIKNYFSGFTYSEHDPAALKETNFVLEMINNFITDEEKFSALNGIIASLERTNTINSESGIVNKIIHYNEQLRSDYHKDHIHYSLASCYASSENFETAWAHIKKINIDINKISAIRKFIEISSKQKENEISKNIISAISRKHNNDEMNSFIGSYYAEKGDFDSSIHFYKKIVKNDGKSEWWRKILHEKIAIAYLKCNDMQNANKYLEKNNGSYSDDTLAKIYMFCILKEKYNEINCIIHSINNDFDKSRAYLLLVQAYLQNDLIDEACSNLNYISYQKHKDFAFSDIALASVKKLNVSLALENLYAIQDHTIRLKSIISMMKVSLSLYQDDIFNRLYKFALNTINKTKNLYEKEYLYIYLYRMNNIWKFSNKNFFLDKIKNHIHSANEYSFVDKQLISQWIDELVKDQNIDFLLTTFQCIINDKYNDNIFMLFHNELFKIGGLLHKQGYCIDGKLLNEKILNKDLSSLNWLEQFFIASKICKNPLLFEETYINKILEILKNTKKNTTGYSSQEKIWNVITTIQARTDNIPQALETIKKREAITFENEAQQEFLYKNEALREIAIELFRQGYEKKSFNYYEKLTCLKQQKQAVVEITQILINKERYNEAEDFIINQFINFRKIDNSTAYTPRINYFKVITIAGNFYKKGLFNVGKKIIDLSDFGNNDKLLYGRFRDMINNIFTKYYDGDIKGAYLTIKQAHDVIGNSEIKGIYFNVIALINTVIELNDEYILSKYITDFSESLTNEAIIFLRTGVSKYQSAIPLIRRSMILSIDNYILAYNSVFMMIISNIIQNNDDYFNIIDQCPQLNLDFLLSSKIKKMDESSSFQHSEDFLWVFVPPNHNLSLNTTQASIVQYFYERQKNAPFLSFHKVATDLNLNYTKLGEVFKNNKQAQKLLFTSIGSSKWSLNFKNL